MERRVTAPQPICAMQRRGASRSARPQSRVRGGWLPPLMADVKRFCARMAFEDKIDELDRMLAAKSTDYEKMRSILRVIRELDASACLLEAAQDNLYASIARSHRKALAHLEAGDTTAAMREMAGAVSWFLRRFPDDLNALAKIPEVAAEVKAARELAQRSKVLSEALNSSYDIHGV